MNKAVFIDKDGTLIKNVSYNVNVDLIEFEPYAFDALKLLQKLGYLLVIVTNQPGIAFEYFTEKELENVHQHIRNTLQQKSISLNGFYFCPHHASGKLQEYSITCNCRKPKPGLLLKAADDLQIDLRKSWMIGDILNDVEAGNIAGCKTILLNKGNETEWQLNKSRKPDFIVDDLLKAANIIAAEKKIEKNELA